MARARNPKGSGDRLRAELLAAANAVLDRTSDPATVTIRGVAAAVGVAPNAVYLHFADRDALLDALVADRFAAFGAHLAAAIAAAPDDPVERLRAGHTAYVEYALAHPGHYRLLFGAPTAPEAVDVALAAFQLCIDGCQGLLDAGLVSGVEAEQLAASIWAMEHGYVELRLARVGRMLPGPVEMLDTLLAPMLRP